MRTSASAVVLDEDPELAGALAGHRLAAARTASHARIADVPINRWNAADAADEVRGGVGLLLLDGLLLRGVGREDAYGAELIEPGDVLRPWEHDGEEAVLPFETTWQVVEPLRVALLDRQWARMMSPYTEVTSALMTRLHVRTLRLATTMAIARQPSVERRVWLLLWHLAERRGRVHPDGVHVELPVGQAVMGRMVGAGRQAVSRALGQLAEQGRLTREDGSVVLSGTAPDLV